jgi:hypothetical protein
MAQNRSRHSGPNSRSTYGCGRQKARRRPLSGFSEKTRLLGRGQSRPRVCLQQPTRSVAGSRPLPVRFMACRWLYLATTERLGVLFPPLALVRGSLCCCDQAAGAFSILVDTSLCSRKRGRGQPRERGREADRYSSFRQKSRRLPRCLDGNPNREACADFDGRAAISNLRLRL